MKPKEISAIKFYKEIEKEKDKYRLVNGLFIVRYMDNDVCYHVGDFLKAKGVLNPKSTNQILLNENPKPQLFNKQKNLTMTGLRVWKPLNIKFIESSIEDIL